MKKYFIPTLIVTIATTLWLVAQNLDEPQWKAMPERALSVTGNRLTSISNLWITVENQATNTRLNYLVVRRTSATAWTLDAGEDKFVKLVEVP